MRKYRKRIHYTETIKDVSVSKRYTWKYERSSGNVRWRKTQPKIASYANEHCRTISHISKCTVC